MLYEYGTAEEQCTIFADNKKLLEPPLNLHEIYVGIYDLECTIINQKL